MAYRPSVMGIFVFGTYIPILSELEVAASCPFELYLECGTHIGSVIYVKYVYSAPC